MLHFDLLLLLLSLTPESQVLAGCYEQWMGRAGGFFIITPQCCGHTPLIMITRARDLTRYLLLMMLAYRDGRTAWKWRWSVDSVASPTQIIVWFERAVPREPQTNERYRPPDCGIGF